MLYTSIAPKINATDWIELKQGDVVIDRVEFEKGDLPTGKIYSTDARQKPMCRFYSIWRWRLGNPNKADNADDHPTVKIIDCSLE